MMELFRHLFDFSSARPVPTDHPSDDVYPVHLLDDTKVHRAAVLTFTLRFNDVLDAQKLSGSLSELLEIGDWRKLGGRLRLKKDGRLQIRVPRPFTKERPACTFSYNDTRLSINQHPTAKLLPKATNAPSVQNCPEDFRAFAAGPGSPVTLQDYLEHDAPMLSVHTTLFKDATIVALSWPHVLMDVLGQQALFKSWSLVLAGRKSEVPPLLDAREDMIATAAARATDQPEEKFDVGQSKLSGFKFLLFAIRFLWDVLRNLVVVRRLIFLPSPAIARLWQRAGQDLIAQHGSEKQPFISEGDLLTAWVTHAVASTLPRPRAITILHAVNARFRLSLLSKSLGVYIQNMSQGSFTFLSDKDAVGPLGPIALENRRQLSKQSTEGQALAFIREQRAQLTAGNAFVFVAGPPDALPLLFTNWTKADIFHTVNFGPAVIQSESVDHNRRNPPGTPIYFHASTSQSSALRSAVMRNTIVVLGKDHDGNYWLSGHLSPRAWAMIDQTIKNI